MPKFTYSLERISKSWISKRRELSGKHFKYVPKIWNNIMMSLLFQIELQTLTSAVGQENEVKSIQIGKKK